MFHHVVLSVAERAPRASSVGVENFVSVGKVCEVDEGEGASYSELVDPDVAEGSGGDRVGPEEEGFYLASGRLEREVV